jgi:hypothetical protein
MAKVRKFARLVSQFIHVNDKVESSKVETSKAEICRWIDSVLCYSGTLHRDVCMSDDVSLGPYSPVRPPTHHIFSHTSECKLPTLNAGIEHCESVFKMVLGISDRIIY